METADAQPQPVYSSQTAPRERFHRRAIGWAVALPLAYALWLATLFAAQDFLVFPGVLRTSRGDEAHIDPAIEQITLTAANGDQVVAWFQTGEGRSPESPGPAVISFGGNGDIVEQRWSACQPYTERGLSVLAVEYRGYGRSAGWPSADRLREDAVAFYDWLAQRPEVDPTRIVAHGHSLGGGVAFALADQRPLVALIAESTFKNTRDRTAQYGAPQWLLRHRFPSDQIAPKLHFPILLMHGRYDGTTPIEDSRRLRQLAPNARLTELECGHSDSHTDWPAVDDFLAENGLRE